MLLSITLLWNNNELNYRIGTMKIVEVELMGILWKDPYSQVLTRLNDYSSLKTLKIHIMTNTQLDQRVYNAPFANQVATIWVQQNNPNGLLKREIVVHTHFRKWQKVKYYYDCYDIL